MRKTYPRVSDTMLTLANLLNKKINKNFMCKHHTAISYACHFLLFVYVNFMLVKPRTDEQFFLDEFLDKFIFSCVRRTIFLDGRTHEQIKLAEEKLLVCTGL